MVGAVLILIPQISAAENISVGVQEYQRIEENLSNISTEIDILKTNIEEMEQGNIESTKYAMEQNIALFTLSAIFQGMCALIALTLIGTTIFYTLTINTRYAGINIVIEEYKKKANLTLLTFFISIALFLITGTFTAISAIFYMPKVKENISIDWIIWSAIISLLIIAIAILALIIHHYYRYREEQPKKEKDKTVIRS